VLEVKTMPAWNALQRVSEIDVTQEIVDGLLALLARHGGGAGSGVGVREVAG
jgi:hypothetical protein